MRRVMAGALKRQGHEHIFTENCIAHIISATAAESTSIQRRVTPKSIPGKL